MLVSSGWLAGDKLHIPMFSQIDRADPRHAASFKKRKKRLRLDPKTEFSIVNIEMLTEAR